MEIFPILLSIKIATITTIISIILGIHIAYFVYNFKKIRGIFDIIFTLAMVLPPTVVGFFLLIIFGSKSIVGKMLYHIGVSIPFSTLGIIISTFIVSFPLMYKSILSGYDQIDKDYIYVSKTLGFGYFKILYLVVIPNSIYSIISGTILCFTRAIGEFGATIMLAGNIRNKTRTISTAIYTAVQSGNRSLAYKYSFIVIIISVLSILFMNYLQNEMRKKCA